MLKTIHLMRHGYLVTLLGGSLNPFTLDINTDGTRYPIDVVNYGYSQQKGHSTAKPIDLLEWLIKTYTNEGMTILDNCMGQRLCWCSCTQYRAALYWN